MRSGVVNASELKDILMEVEMFSQERDRQVMLQQRQYEEQVRREANLQKERELNVLEDLTGLLRNVIQQMRPATQQYPPHSWAQDHSGGPSYTQM